MPTAFSKQFGSVTLTVMKRRISPDNEFKTLQTRIKWCSNLGEYMRGTEKWNGNWLNWFYELRGSMSLKEICASHQISVLSPRLRGANSKMPSFSIQAFEKKNNLSVWMQMLSFFLLLRVIGVSSARRRTGIFVRHSPRWISCSGFAPLPREKREGLLVHARWYENILGFCLVSILQRICYTWWCEGHAPSNFNEYELLRLTVDVSAYLVVHNVPTLD